MTQAELRTHARAWIAEAFGIPECDIDHRFIEPIVYIIAKAFEAAAEQQEGDFAWSS